jgi:hypothetical protein
MLSRDHPPSIVNLRQIGFDFPITAITRDVGDHGDFSDFLCGEIGLTDIQFSSVFLRVLCG